MTDLARDAERSRAWLEGETAHGDALRARARCAARALAARPVHGAAHDLDAALDDAAILFDAGLFFEVHELLEPHWRDASGDAREALQGLIQIAVGYQHQANGNLRGARALLAEGAERVRGRVIAGRSLTSVAERVQASLSAIEDLPREGIPPFPRKDHEGFGA